MEKKGKPKEGVTICDMCVSNFFFGGGVLVDLRGVFGVRFWINMFFSLDS